MADQLDSRGRRLIFHPDNYQEKQQRQHKPVSSTTPTALGISMIKEAIREVSACSDKGGVKEGLVKLQEKVKPAANRLDRHLKELKELQKSGGGRKKRIAGMSGILKQIEAADNQVAVALFTEVRMIKSQCEKKRDEVRRKGCPFQTDYADALIGDCERLEKLYVQLQYRWKYHQEGGGGGHYGEEQQQYREEEEMQNPNGYDEKEDKKGPHEDEDVSKKGGKMPRFELREQLLASIPNLKEDSQAAPRLSLFSGLTPITSRKRDRSESKAKTDKDKDKDKDNSGKAKQAKLACPTAANTKTRKVSCKYNSMQTMLVTNTSPTTGTTATATATVLEGLASTILRTLGKHPTQPPLNNNLRNLLRAKTIEKFHPNANLDLENLAYTQDKVVCDVDEWWKRREASRRPGYRRPSN